VLENLIGQFLYNKAAEGDTKRSRNLEAERVAKANKLRAALLLAGMLAGCATSGRNPADPLEPLNRVVFSFNDTADQAVIKPVARAYRAVLPGIVRTGVSNFFSNLEDVWISVNDVLQGKFQQGLDDFGRVLFNSTFGIAGIFDFASELGFQKHNEDFGQTLGSWGVGSGAYLVLPILGPSTIRDGFGLLLDTRADLVFYIDGVPCITPSTGRARSPTAPTCSMLRALSSKRRSTSTRSCAKPGCSADATSSTTASPRGSVRNPMMNPPSNRNPASMKSLSTCFLHC